MTNYEETRMHRIWSTMFQCLTQCFPNCFLKELNKYLANLFINYIKYIYFFRNDIGIF